MKRWQRLITIPGYLVLGIGDNGICETYNQDNTLAESDDLCISIELSTGMKVLLDGNQRLLIQDNGDIIIEALTEMKSER